MASFKCIKLPGVLVSSQILLAVLVSRVSGFAIFANPLIEFPVVSYQSEEGSDLLRCCWWIHILNCISFRR